MFGANLRQRIETFSLSSHSTEQREEGKGTGSTPFYKEDLAELTTILPDKGIRIPQNATNIRTKLLSANVWNTTPNVSKLLGDRFNFTAIIPDPVSNLPVERVFDFTFNRGLYSLEELKAALVRKLENVEPEVDTNILNMDSNYPEQKVTFSTTNAGGVKILNPTGSIRKLLGFPEDGKFVLDVPYGYIVQAPLKAQFNRLNWYEVHCTLSSPGLEVGFGQSRNLLGTVNINKNPNSLLTHEPNNPPSANSSSLRGATITQIKTAWFSDDGVTPAPSYESWNVIVELTWLEPWSNIA